MKMPVISLVEWQKRFGTEKACANELSFFGKWLWVRIMIYSIHYQTKTLVTVKYPPVLPGGR